MIKESTIYTVICDNCKTDVNEGEEYSAWNDAGYAEDIASYANWVKVDEYHYCPKCYTYDDDDNLVVL